MLQVRFTRLPSGGKIERTGETLARSLPGNRLEMTGRANHEVALRHLAGEALVRRFLREQGLGDHHEIQKGEKGKPFIAGINVHFNVSHSGDHVVAAFSDRRVGIDIERRGRVRLEIAARFFHPGEVAALLATREEERASALADYWAIKESFLKYLGTGLTRPLSTFRVKMEKTDILLYDREVRLSLHVQCCPVSAFHACFACGETSAPPVIAEIGWDDLYNKEFR